MKLTGIFAPVPTPFDGGGEIDERGWIKNVRIWSDSELDGIVVCGSNGELPFIKMEERVRLTELAVKEARGQLTIMTGAHFPSTRETIECAKALAAAGAQYLLLLPPHYYKGKTEPILKYFEDVADESPVPVFMYNMPANTGVDMDAETIIKAARHPNIVGIKDTSGNMTKMGYVVRSVPDRFSVFGGTGNYILAALGMGACGGTMAIAILYPNSCRALFDSFEAGDIKKAIDIQSELLPVSDAVTRRFGVASLKYAMEQFGMTGGQCRAPILPLAEKNRAEVMEIIKKSKLGRYENRT
jgi:4-hydroxy-2-oxoglutarate aldolase